MFAPEVYAARREALMRAIGPAGVVVVRSLPERLRNGDAYHAFRQHSDIVYLTGFVEPDTTLVLRPGAPKERFVMFVRPRDREYEIWDGARAGVEGAVARHGADAAYPTSELSARLGDLVANADELHYALGIDPDMDRIVAAAIARLRHTERKNKRPPRAVVDPRVALHELRMYKQPEELATLRTAAAITCEAHVAAMQHGRPGITEREVAALLDYTFRRGGGAGPGYETIVGAGANATTLHYVARTATIAEGDLVLVDAGCEYDHYTADVTRTWPASGTFSAPQRRIYEVVLAAQEGAIAMARPGVTIDELKAAATRTLTEGMIEIGLLEGPVEARLEDKVYMKFFMHGLSHWLGLDVHDVGAYMRRDGTARPLEPGMVITIEPGIYVAADAEHVPDAYRGIGVRIEDDVVITDDGNEVLTAACPKAPADVEAACRRTA